MEVGFVKSDALVSEPEHKHSTKALIDVGKYSIKNIITKNMIVLKTVSFLARLGVCISGLCQDTSAHPRSSARITTCKFQFKSGGDFSLLFVLFQAW